MDSYPTYQVWFILERYAPDGFDRLWDELRHRLILSDGACLSPPSNMTWVEGGFVGYNWNLRLAYRNGNVILTIKEFGVGGADFLYDVAKSYARVLSEALDARDAYVVGLLVRGPTEQWW